MDKELWNELNKLNKGKKLPKRCPTCGKYGSNNCICGDNKK
jgi:hypothetical protein